MHILAAPINIPNITHWQVLGDFRPGTGQFTVRVYLGADNTRYADFPVALSDTAGQSMGIVVNPGPFGFGDTLMVQAPRAGIAGVGAQNALTNALNVYRAAANHLAGLVAIEAQIITDGIVPPQMG